MDKGKPISRREFLKLVGGGAGAALLASFVPLGLVGREPPSQTAHAAPQNVAPPLDPARPGSPQPSATPAPANTPLGTIDRAHLTQAEQGFLVNHNVRSVDASRNIVAITCDDFPDSPEQLAMILDGLKGAGHATFFLIGKDLESLADGKLRPYGWPNADLIKRILDEGHELASHTYTHHILTRMDDWTLDSEFTRWLAAADKIIPGYRPAFFRASGGYYDERVLRFGAKYGMQHALWNALSGGMDAGTYDRVIAEAKPGTLLLTHVMRPYDVQDMGKIARELKSRGYVLETLSNAIRPEDRLTF